MQATSSQVTPSFNVSSFVPVDMDDHEPGLYILPVLQRDAKSAGRDHLLVGRRRRSKRRLAR